MKRAVLVLVGSMMAGGMAAAEATGIEESTGVVFDVEGTELSVGDCNAVRGLGPCNVWEDGNKGYYRPGTVADADSPEIQAIRKAQLKQSAHEMVDIAEEFPGTWKDVVVKVGVYFLHKMIDLY